MNKTPFSKDIYIISDSVDVLKDAIQAGSSIVQLRDKSSSGQIILAKAREMVAFKRLHAFLFILNDDWEAALEAGADGVHIGQDLSTREARQRLGDGLILGKTTHHLDQARQAVAEGADYVSAGPVYATPTKPGRPAVGLDYVKQVATASLGVPFVAIGGIDLSNIHDVLEAGASTVGIVRAHQDTTALLALVRSRP